MANSVAEHQYQQALAAVDNSEASETEKVEMLMEIAMGLQTKPGAVQQIIDAVSLYDEALALCPENRDLLAARIHARKATALQIVPAAGAETLLKAKEEIETALPVLTEYGIAEEIAEAEMNLGLILQNLASLHQALITDAINAYQRALRTFSKEKYPVEFAILHNNLATAYLAIPLTDQRARMREALAVQSFEEALKVVTLIDQPVEYAMLQNNLGNALQYASSSHAVENNLRALDAYDEALKVRTRKDTPVEYANTVSNKANCLRNLPDDVEYPQAGNRSNLLTARDLYREARDIFDAFGDTEKVSVIDATLQELETDILEDSRQKRGGNGFGEARI